MARKATTDLPFHFETAMAELQLIVEKMEQGGLSLEDSLQFFEKGIALTRQCQHALQHVEQKVKMLVEKNGHPTLESYQEPEDNL